MRARYGGETGRDATDRHRTRTTGEPAGLGTARWLRRRGDGVGIVRRQSFALFAFPAHEDGGVTEQSLGAAKRAMPRIL